MVLLKIMSYFGAKFDFEAKIIFFSKVQSEQIYFFSSSVVNFFGFDASLEIFLEVKNKKLGFVKSAPIFEIDVHRQPAAFPA